MHPAEDVLFLWVCIKRLGYMMKHVCHTMVPTMTSLIKHGEQDTRYFPIKMLSYVLT